MAVAVNPDAAFHRAIIYDPEDGGGVYVFLFRLPGDGPSDADYWYEDVAGAERHAVGELGVEIFWRPIPDPEPGDWHS